MSITTSSIDPAEIDAAWEERVLPALSEYTRIPCLSPAFDPEWQAHGHIDAAAALLRQWVDDQGAGLTTEIVRLPGTHAGPHGRQRGQRRPDRHLRPHGQAAAARRLARGPRAPTNRCARAICSSGAGTADDGYATFAAVTAPGRGGRWAGPRARADRGQRGERQPRPGGSTSSTWRERIGTPRW